MMIFYFWDITKLIRGQLSGCGQNESFWELWGPKILYKVLQLKICNVFIYIRIIYK